MDFEEAINSILGLFGFNRAEEAEEVGTTQPALDEEQMQLQYQLGDLEMLADIFNAQRTRENPQIELGARYMDKHRTEYPEGLATLMFQPTLSSSALGSAIPAHSSFNTVGGKHHQVLLKTLEDLEKHGYNPNIRDETIFHELGHIGEYTVVDYLENLIKSGTPLPLAASDYGMMGTTDIADGYTTHSAIRAMDKHYGEDPMRGTIPRGENLGPTEFNKEEVFSKLNKTYDEIQAEINAEMKRIGKGKWNSTLDELVAQRDRAKASPTKSIEVTNEEAKNIVLAEQARVDNQNEDPAEQILNAIFNKELEDRMVAGAEPEARFYFPPKNPQNAKFLSEKYGFDVTDFSPENVAKMVDNMKKHTRAANELADRIIKEGSY